MLRLFSHHLFNKAAFNSLNVLLLGPCLCHDTISIVIRAKQNWTDSDVQDTHIYSPIPTKQEVDVWAVSVLWTYLYIRIVSVLLSINLCTNRVHVRHCYIERYYCSCCHCFNWFMWSHHYFLFPYFLCVNWLVVSYVSYPVDNHYGTCFLLFILQKQL